LILLKPVIVVQHLGRNKKLNHFSIIFWVSSPEDEDEIYIGKGGLGG
jgi:hypothetical protein